eukprot:CAMPEP_0185017988 /NCGR_PEP_ID=MMETSP1103-20130426/833_1 /TAXON_ID=36769 /ORGANISM="Paraphysomonas bandaiensis, Strain Caron Lab Isolate" /LENGTH=1086 /DNA_ID=CAMNT_0027547625 /DNA_START=99 /DNA_END=3356 /DNA_ORIENTATION=-
MILLDRINSWKEKFGSKVALSFLDKKGDVEAAVTYEEVDAITTAIGHHLVSAQGAALKPGDRVLLVYPPSLDFILAFLACLKTGVVAVPVFPPDPTRLNKDLTMFANLVKSCEAKAALTSSAYDFATKMASLHSVLVGGHSLEWPELRWVVTDGLVSMGKSGAKCEPLSRPVISNDGNVAFLQFTSGSSSSPKGVIITVNNLDHNLDLIARSLRSSENTVCVSWLPQYHDMGLIGSYLGLLWCGGTGYYMSPLTFIRNPVLWVVAMSRYHCTHSQAPDFAFALTARKFLSMGSREKATLLPIDLSCVRHMISAAEPVRAASIDTFCAVFCKHGLRKEVIYPTYGLAEHTVFVCSNGRGRIMVDKQILEKDRVVTVREDGGDGVAVHMGCGKPTDSPGVVVKIVGTVVTQNENQKFEDLGSGRVGEVWIASGSTAYGYWKGCSLSDADREDFMAKLSDDSGSNNYLRTGDLGFFHDGELYICGRCKDVIIVRGRNHFPQDIERSCEAACPELRSGCTGAFSVPSSKEERVVVVAEIRDDYLKNIDIFDSIVDRMVRQTGREHGITPSTVILISPRSLPKTTSGKVARRWARKAYLEGKLNIIHYVDTSAAGKILPVIDEFSYTKSTIAAHESNSLLDATDVTRYEDAVDPEGMTEEEVRDIVIKSVSNLLDLGSFSELSPDKPLASFGIDSMKMLELQEMLCRKFTTQLSDDVLFDKDATLRSIARALSMGGQLPFRPYMIEVWKLISHLREQKRSKRTVTGRLPEQWFNGNKISADISTHRFADACALQEAPLPTHQGIYYVLYLLFACGVFFWVPIAVVSGAVLFPLKLSVALMTVLLSLAYLVPADCWPPGFRLSLLMQSATNYFSYRVIVDSPHDLENVSIYAHEPHGWIPFAQPLQAMVNEFIIGENFHMLVASSGFWMPVFNIFLKILSCRPIDKKTFISTLNSGRSVLLVPGGIGEMFENSGSGTEVLKVCGRKGFVRIAIQTGAQIVPCYTFGNWELFEVFTPKAMHSISRILGVPLLMFWGRWGLPIPKRVPLLTVIGRPIQCPHDSNPSAELVNEYHEAYMRETKVLFDKYKNAYAW